MLESRAAAWTTVERGMHPPLLSSHERIFFYIQMRASRLCKSMPVSTLLLCFVTFSLFFFSCNMFFSSFRLQIEQEEAQCSKKKNNFLFYVWASHGFIFCSENAARTTKHRWVFLVSRIISVIVLIFFSVVLLFVFQRWWPVFSFASVSILVGHCCTACYSSA